MQESPSWRLVLWPSALALAITILRLAGELLDWSPSLFNRSVGGGAALVGIIWLVPIFGSYFAVRLAAADRRPRSLAIALGVNVASFVVLVAFLAVGFSRPTASASQFLAIGAGSWVAIAVAWKAWPALVAALVRYGLLSRVPVALVVLCGIVGDWKTHYDSPPPGLPAMGTLGRWIATGVIPQLTLWMAVTVVVGMLCGIVATAIAARRRRSQQLASA
jgi:hypothetical protein